MGAVAVDCGGVAKEDADVMEHGGGFNLSGVEGETVAGGYFQRQVGDGAGMAHIDIPKG